MRQVGAKNLIAPTLLWCEAGLHLSDTLSKRTDRRVYITLVDRDVARMSMWQRPTMFSFWKVVGHAAYPS